MDVWLEKVDHWVRRMNHRPGVWLSIFASLLAIQVGSCWYPTQDSCIYLSLARSLASGEGMTELGEPRVAVPPGYPLLISPAFWWDDRPFLLLSCLHWIMAVVMMLGVYRWMRQQFPSEALLITGLTMVNMGVWYYYRRTLKEIAFMAVVIWTVNVVHDLLRSTNGREVLRRVVPAALLLLLAVLIRYSGIVLLAGFGVACFVKLSHSQRLRRWTLPILMTVGVAGAATLLFVLHVGGDVYLQAFSATSANLVTRLADGIWLQINGIGRAVVPGMFKAYSERGEWWDINMLVYLPVFFRIAFGWWRFVRRRNDVLALTLPFYLALYVAWPFDQGARFVIPMVPVLMACLWFGQGVLLRNRSVLFVLLVAGHLIAGLGYWVIVDIPRAQEDHAYWAAVDQIRDSIPTDRDKVLAVNIPDKMDMMLQLALDRRLSTAESGTVPPSNVRWIVQAADTPPPDEFTVRRLVNDFQVLARRRSSPEKPSVTPLSKADRKRTRLR